jgi:hypothetical protein
MVMFAEGVAFAFGVGADPVCFGAGGGDLLVRLGLDGGDLRGSVAAQLLELVGRGAGGVGGMLACLPGGGEIVAGGGERFSEGGGFLAGFGGLGLGGNGGGFGAAAGGLGVGDLGADSSRVEAGGLLAGGADQDGGLADQRVEGGQRVLAGSGQAGSGGGDAGVVMVAAGAVGATELAAAAAGLGGQRAAAAGTLADRGMVTVAGGGLAGHRGAFLRQARLFLFLSRERRNEKNPRALVRVWGQEMGGMPARALRRAWCSQMAASSRVSARPTSV